MDTLNLSLAISLLKESGVVFNSIEFRNLSPQLSVSCYGRAIASGNALHRFYSPRRDTLCALPELARLAISSWITKLGYLRPSPVRQAIPETPI